MKHITKIRINLLLTVAFVLVFLCCIPSKWTIIFGDLSHFAIFLSLLEHETPCKCPFGHLLSHIKQQTIGSNFY